MSKLLVIYNKQSGSSDLASLQDACQAYGLKADFIPIQSHSLKSSLAAVRNDARVTVVAAGGDGTINSVVTHILGGKCRLGVIPAGTLNHFAKALSIPQTLEEAVGAIAAGHTTHVDVGSVNGHVFVNNASIGFYPRSLRFREEYEQKIGKWPAAILGLTHAVLHPRRYTIDIVTDGAVRSLRTPFIFVGNNEYKRSGPGLGERSSLHEGTLALYVVKATSPIGIINALLHTFMTKKRRTRDFAIHSTQSATIHTRHHSELRVACDGEAFLLKTPLHFKIHPAALRVITLKEEKA